MTITELAPLRTGLRPAPGSYTLNLDRCLAQFSIRHLVVSTTRGTLAPLGGQLVVEEDPLATWVRVDLDAASWQSGSSERDDAVRGPNFLAAENFAVIRYESVAIDATPDGQFDVIGDLYLRELVGELTLSARVVSVSPHRVLVAASGEFSRGAYGLSWPPATEHREVGLADAVRVDFGAEFVR
jgi:polyisoprenoid-binding protein YceI